MSASPLEQYRARVAALQARPGYAPPAAFGLGTSTRSMVGDGSKVLDAHFLTLNLDESLGFAAVVADLVGATEPEGTYELTRADLEAAIDAFAPVIDDGGAHPNARLLPLLLESLDRDDSAMRRRRTPVFTMIRSLDAPPLDTCDIYLRLHLISSRRLRPHGCSLENMFGLLNNVVWTSHGPFDPEEFETTSARLDASGSPVFVRSLDKFPPMLDYVMPSGVRVADASRVRLGAHLAEGTTVMHEGFVNFNAGTLGPAMVEGRISAGVVVGANSDLGGSASIMGTLSGGGTQVVSVGEGCLLGANSGLGISLGDNCLVEAGLYVTAGTRVTLPDGTVTKARDLSGLGDMLFRRNSLTGAVEMIPQTAEWNGLNAALHSND